MPQRHWGATVYPPQTGLSPRSDPPCFPSLELLKIEPNRSSTDLWGWESPCQILRRRMSRLGVRVREMTKCLKGWTFAEKSLGSSFLGLSSISCAATDILDIFTSVLAFKKKKKKDIDTSWVKKLMKNFGKPRNRKEVLSETLHSDQNQNISLRLQPL